LTVRGFPPKCVFLLIVRSVPPYNRNMNEIKVLIADDHSLTRKGIRAVLEDYPEYRIVSEVGDGPSLMKALEETRPDCILVDISMPDFDPIMATKQIRGQHPDIKILIISAYDDDVYVQGLLRAGVHGYHLKGEPLSDFRLAIEKIMSGERWLSSPLVQKIIGTQSSTPNTTTLTPRQLDFLFLLQKGYDNKAIANQLGISLKTVENSLTRLYLALDVRSRLEAVNYANDHPEIFSLSIQNKFMLEQIEPPVTATAVNILLVDDNPSYRKELNRSLRFANPTISVYDVENTDQAVRFVQTKRASLIFVDMILGDESGIECVRKIKDVDPNSKIVLMSAYPDLEFRRQGLEAGAIVFIDKKDLNKATLRQIIADATSKKDATSY
jgi:DNA-binding NarL/FixJ family response regulator